VEDEVYQLIMQFIANDKQATEWHKDGKISFDSALKMKASNAENFSKVLNELNKFMS
jgi:hypothetical protein